MSWERAINFTLRWEGGYTNHPADRGGPTNRGITQGVLQYAYNCGIVPHNNIKSLTKVEAMIIYKMRYWQPYGWDDIMPPADMIMFDMAVNHGIGGAAKIAQRACVSLGQVVKIDGKFGKQTKSTLVALSGINSLTLSKMLLIKRLNFYDKIVENNPSQSVFLPGWCRRTRDLAREVGIKL